MNWHKAKLHGYYNSFGFLFIICFHLLLPLGATKAQSINWNGDWTGYWSEPDSTLPCTNIANDFGGSMSFNLSVTNNTVTGTGTLSGIVCYDPNTCTVIDFDNGSGTVSGTVSGNTISFDFNFAATSGTCMGSSETLTIVGTCAGSTITGNFGEGSSILLVGGSGSGGNPGGPGNPPVSDTPDPEVQCLGCNCSKANPAVSEPIRVATGNLYEEVGDYATAGMNPLQFTRYYNSLGDATTEGYMLGMNWRSTYDRYIRPTLSGGVVSVVAERPDGQELIFTNNGSGSWKSYSDIDVKLTQSATGWTLTNGDDTVETYDANGLLEAFQSRDGYWEVFNYDSSNYLDSVIDSFGRSLEFTYQSNLLHTVTTPSGLILTYNYDSSGATPGVLDRLVSVTYSTTPQTSVHYVYENPALPFALTGIIDENGNRFSTWTYDSSGRATSSEHAGGTDLTTIIYNEDGSREVVSPLGLTNVYKFAMIQGVPKNTKIDRLATANVPAATTTYSYDPNGYIATISDWKTNETSTVNDIHDQPLVINEAVGTPQARATTNAYHATFHLPVHVVAPRETFDFTYDVSGNMLARAETDTSTGTVPYSTSGQIRTWNYSYDDVRAFADEHKPARDNERFYIRR